MNFERRDALEIAAADRTITPWQREIMFAITRGTTQHRTSAWPRDPDDSSPQRIATSGADGEWAGFLPSGIQGCTAIYDPVRDRMVMFGGYDGSRHNDVWALTLSENPVWSVLTASGSPPRARTGHSALYDPVRDRMLVFGGSDSSNSDRNDVWALTLSESPSWSALTPSGTLPPERFGHTTIYDPVRDRMVVFGGFGDGLRNDVWALALSGSPAWSELAPSETLPQGRYSHTAIYDPMQDRMVVFGGYDDYNILNDAWALTLSGSSAWSALAPSGSLPTPRYRHTAIYDSVRDRMLVFGGCTYGYPFYSDDVWELTLSGSPAWSALTPSGSLPPGRYLHTAIYDPARDRMVVFGGLNAESNRNDSWTLTLSGSPAWTALVTGSPKYGLYDHTAIYDPLRDRMVVFGGTGGGNYSNDVWTLTLSGSPEWRILAPAGSRPTARYRHTALYDPVRDRMIVFGGFDGLLSGPRYRNDVWALTLSGSPAWSALAPSGSLPPNCDGHAAVYDPVRDRMIVFGGSDGSSLSNDVWALTLSGSPAWSALVPSGSLPSRRQGHTAIYDPVRDRMIVFAGSDAYVDRLRDDVWALTLSGNPSWSALSPLGSAPPGRYEHAAIYDPVRDRIVVFGGFDGENPGGINDAWTLTLSGSPAWSPLAPSGSIPPGRFRHTAIYDPSRDRMVVFAGTGFGDVRQDVWALNWNFSTTPVQLSFFTCERVQDGVRTTWALGDWTSAEDVWLERADVIAGPWVHPLTEQSRARDAIVELDRAARADKNYWYRLMIRQADRVTVIGQPVLVGATEVLNFSLLGITPNPSNGPFRIGFSVAREGPIELEAFDVQGRMAASLARGVWSAGRHTVEWSARSGQATTSGMYFVRFKYPGGVDVRRVVRSD